MVLQTSHNPREPGGVYTYEFTAEPVGSFMYHSHVETDKQIMLGLYVRRLSIRLSRRKMRRMWM